MGYDHTQKAPLHYVFYPLVVAFLVLAWISRTQPLLALLALAGALLLLVMAFVFRQLTVRDEGSVLAIRFGPLPAFSRRVAYADITSVEPGRSAIIDGWGIHYIPGRGTTYNLWGFACVKLVVKGKVVRIGTDDAVQLAEFLRSRI